MSAVSSMLLVVGARRDDAHGVVEEAAEPDLLDVEPDAAGLDLRHVEDVVDDVEQVLAALVDVACSSSWYFSAPSGPNMPDSMISEKPMMALSGVRSSWLMLARKLDFAWLASSARVFSSEYFSARSASSSAWRSSVRCEARRSATVAHQPLLALHQLFFVPLDGGDVGADRDVAAVLGAPLADVQPAAVLELRLEGARARRPGLRSSPWSAPPACGRRARPSS